MAPEKGKLNRLHCSRTLQRGRFWIQSETQRLKVKEAAGNFRFAIAQSPPCVSLYLYCLGVFRMDLPISNWVWTRCCCVMTR